jgi:hypothetical protein
MYDPLLFLLAISFQPSAPGQTSHRSRNPRIQNAKCKMQDTPAGLLIRPAILTFAFFILNFAFCILCASASPL